MSNYAIALCLSFVTACFTLASSWTKDPSRTYWYQVGQCLVYACASYFYGVYASIVVMLINACRNYLVATGKYKSIHCWIFSILAIALGLWVNTSGLVGIISIAAAVQYSICSYYLKEEIPVKVNNIINVLLWLIYDILVLDIFSAAMDLSSAVLSGITIFRIRQDQKVA